MCTWQSITNFLDSYYVVLFGMSSVGIFVTAVAMFAAESRIAKRIANPEERRRWRKRARERGPYNEELRAANYGWLVQLRRITIIAAVATIAYPLLSPTFCLNNKCARPMALFPPVTSCGDGPSVHGG